MTIAEFEAHEAMFAREFGLSLEPVNGVLSAIRSRGCSNTDTLDPEGELESDIELYTISAIYEGSLEAEEYADNYDEAQEIAERFAHDHEGAEIAIYDTFENRNVFEIRPSGAVLVA